MAAVHVAAQLEQLGVVRGGVGVEAGHAAHPPPYPADGRAEAVPQPAGLAGPGGRHLTCAALVALHLGPRHLVTNVQVLNISK